MKKRTKLWHFFLLLSALCLIFSGCGEEQPATVSLFAMDTLMDLTVYGDEKALQEANVLIFSLEGQVSVTDPASQIYKINQEGQGSLTGRAKDLLTQALALCQRTEGALDISVYPLVKAWGFTTGSYQVPSEARVQELLKQVDYRKIRLDGDNVQLPEGMELDLGSVAKGYLGNLLADYFRSQGITSGILSLGGNVQAIGAKPDGSPWNVGIKDPEGGDYLGILRVTDQAVVTSGGYERFFEENGETYWHILDPKTGYPAKNGLISVTVIGRDGLVCDGLSTALFVMGLDKAQEFWRNSSDFEAVFVTDSGEIFVTQGADFTLREGQDRNVTVISR